jgi:para-nitrobenzyl esterase
MVWIHGGGFSVSSGSLPIFDGEALARRGVVLVTLNYRIGGLGFLAHPELTRESPESISGNWGLLDQIAALHWVQQNIEGFGGDPQNVTIFGQSVGSTCVNCLMASPLTHGLFHRAIGESGGSMVPLGRPGGGSMLRLAEAEKIGLRVADSFGCNSLDDLRAKPARDLQLLWPKHAECRPFIVVDGSIVPEAVYDTFAAGRQHPVPLLTGANSDEASARGPAANLQEWILSLQSEFGEEWTRLFEAYGGGENFAHMSRRLACQKGFNWVNWTWARLHAKLAQGKVFFYHFSHAPPLPSGKTFAEGDAGMLGAYHTAEIPYVFGTLSKREWPWTDADFELSDVMSSYWVNFATYGDPNRPGLPKWPVFDPNTPSVMLFNDEVAPDSLPERRLFDLWDDCMERLRG